MQIGSFGSATDADRETDVGAGGSRLKMVAVVMGLRERGDEEEEGEPSLFFIFLLFRGNLIISHTFN
ncbi:hypothetical protein HanRHA438_Chr10g0436261 [Helianthus annuus]|nr:hypothetical protein HanRHA438_Chr10g0436261 [Helianthus annuus]